MAHVKINSDGLYPLNNDMNVESTTTYVGDLAGATVTLGFYGPDGIWTPFPNGELTAYTPLSISHGHEVKIVAFALNVTDEINIETKKQGIGGLQGLIVESFNSFLNSISSTFNNLKDHFVKTLSLSSSEFFASEGLRFNQNFDSIFGPNETKYYLYYLPPEATVTVGLQNRFFKSRDGGCSLEILWDSTGYSVSSVSEVFNENNKYEGGNQFKVSEVTEPTVAGRIRETDFLSSSGTGNNSSGDVSSELGYRLYVPGTYFIAKITNKENHDNRVILGYSWIEASDVYILLPTA